MDFTQQQRTQSFGHAAPAQQQPQQQHQLSRPSPFASSGPVAMVNQIRPGAPGQFPGVAVRTNPTQLATPLVPTRRLSGATDPSPHHSTAPASSATPLVSDARSRDALFPSPPTSTSSASSLFGPPPTLHAQATAAPPTPLSGGRYHSMDHIAPSYGASIAHAPSMAPAPDLFPRVERSSANSLVGVSPTQSPVTRAFNQNFDNLFGPADTSQPAIPPPLLPPQPPVRSTQSFSYDQTAHNDHLHQLQQQQYHETRGFSQPPPPAAPFLGYAESTRTQSTTSLSSSSTTAPSPRVSLHQRTGSGTLGLAAPSPRIHAVVRTADELLEEFLHMSLEDQYLGGGTDGALFPEYSTPIVPPAKRLTLADVPDTVEGLEELYRQKRWKTLTKKSLSMLQNPSNDAALTLEVKSWWLAGLIKDGHYDNATSVLDQIGDLDDPVASSGSSTSSSSNVTRDPFVSMRLRLLEAMLYKYKGNAAEHEKKLFQLIARIRNAITHATEAAVLGCYTETASQWLRLSQFALVNHLVLQNKFSLALRVSATIDLDHLQAFERVIMLSRLGRIHLQMGDLTNAEHLFALARSAAETGAQGQAPGCVDTATGELRAHLRGRLLVNDGLLLFAQSKLQEALSAFDAALNLEMARAHRPDANVNANANANADFASELLLEEDLVGVAVNNFAICALYCCDVKGAVAALERMIRSDPVRFLNAVVVFNLSSLYDLIYDNATSASRKEMMKKLAELYDLEHIDAAAFRI